MPQVGSNSRLGTISIIDMEIPREFSVLLIDVSLVPSTCPYPLGSLDRWHTYASSLAPQSSRPVLSAQPLRAKGRLKGEQKAS